MAGNSAARLTAATVLVLILASGCFGTTIQRAAQTQGNPIASIGQPFVIKGTETITLDSGKLSVTLQEVKGDSRCPVGVSCIWEGDATVVLWLKSTDHDAMPIEIHTSSRFATEATYEGYRIKLQELKPQPRPNAPTDQKAYMATLLITRG